MSEITGVWIDEYKTFTLADWERVLDECSALKPLQIRGHDFYWFAINHPEQEHDIACLRARQDWRDYYRAVRTLRRIRQSNVAQFQRFSQAWYRGSYKEEIDATQWPHPSKRERRLP